MKESQVRDRAFSMPLTSPASRTLVCKRSPKGARTAQRILHGDTCWRRRCTSIQPF